MRVILTLLLLFAITVNSPAQLRKGDRVKRKYQQVDQVNQDLPPVNVHGRVLNADREKLPGATVIVRGTSIGVNTNEEGEYFLTGLPTGKISVQVSFVGYKTKIIDYYVKEGENDIYFTLDREAIALEPVTVTSQLREQQLPDIPASISVLNGTVLENRDIRDMTRLADYIPGLFIREQTPHRPNYVIRGLTSDEVSLSAQPRVSVYYNNIPVSRGSMASNELYDLERVEVLKGPQQTLFGRGAQIGVVQYITRKPGSATDGYLTAGAGDFGMKEFQGALNVPVLKDKIFARAAGIYSFRDGYVDNTVGDKLNGRNTLGGRFSLRILPFYNTKIDLMVNYQRDDLPGTAFMSKQFPNTNGITDIFQYEASLEQGSNLKNYRDLLGTSLEIKHFRNENNYFSATTSYFTNGADSRWDGDGTIAPAIDMAETMNVSQFTQEIRYNFSRNSRTNGSIGINYWREKAEQSYWFGPNEQYTSYLILQMPQYLFAPDGNTYPMPGLPNDPQLGPLAGMPLPANHEEEIFSSANNQAYDVFADATRRLTRKLSFTAGVRATLESFRVSNDSVSSVGSPSTLGMLTGMYPNLFFKQADPEKVSKTWLAFTYRANLQYMLSANSSVFAGYSKGRRPNVIQFNSAGASEIMDAEKLHNFEAGVKSAIARRLWFDLTGYYHLFRDFQTNIWENNNYLVKDGGKATAYGVESSVRVAVLKNLDFFGNYAYIHARFDSIDSDGNTQLFAGNEFRLTPEHSYTAGINGRIKLTRNVQFFVTPSWSWKSHVWFEDANTEGLDQDAYGMLNATAGFTVKNPDLLISINGTNLLEEKYVISAGNTGTMFGVPTFIPGAPRMISGKITWKF